jgi:hypothetical protein
VIKTNASLGVSFALPDRLTVDQLDDYQQHIGRYLSDYKDTFLSTARYRAMVYSAAVESGMIADWQCAAMPELRPAEVGQADARVINFVGLAVEDYITAYTTISPN